MNQTITAASISKTIVITCGHDDFDPLYGGQEYEILVGLVCAECHRQYFYESKNGDLIP